MASLGKPRPYTGKNEKAGKHLGPSGLKSQVPMYERFELKGTPKVVWFSLPACSFKAQGQNNSYQKFMQYFPASTATWSIQIQPFPWVDSICHSHHQFILPCLLNKAWLRCPALWYHHPVFRFSSSSLACLLCLAMWYFPSHEATKKVFTRCCADARPIHLEFSSLPKAK